MIYFIYNWFNDVKCGNVESVFLLCTQDNVLESKVRCIKQWQIEILFKETKNTKQLTHG